jgi:hypothetical protein
LTDQELPRKKERESARLAKGNGKPVREKTDQNEEERLDGRLVAQVMSSLLGRKMTFEACKEWTQGMDYAPLIDIPPSQAVMEVLHAGINLVSKHVKTAAAILQKYGGDLYAVLAELDMEKDVTGWEWEKSRVVRKRALEWIPIAFKKAGISRPTESPWLPGGQRSDAQQLLESLLHSWKLLHQVLDICELESPSEEVIEWFGTLVLAFGCQLRDGPLSRFHTFSIYDHLLICHSYIQLLTWGSLACYGSWYLEAGSALWKSVMRQHTSQGGGVGGGASHDKQALQALSIRQNYAVSDVQVQRGVAGSV